MFSTVGFTFKLSSTVNSQSIVLFKSFKLISPTFRHKFQKSTFTRNNFKAIKVFKLIQIFLFLLFIYSHMNVCTKALLLNGWYSVFGRKHKYASQQELLIHSHPALMAAWTATFLQLKIAALSSAVTYYWVKLFCSIVLQWRQQMWPSGINTRACRNHFWPHFRTLLSHSSNSVVKTIHTTNDKK